MWRARLPRRDPDGLYAAGLVVGIPAVLLILNGAPIVVTLLVAAAIAGVLILIR
jgi:hypothetical protein